MNGLLDFLQGASNAAASNISGPVDLIGMGLRKLGVPVPQNALLSSQWMEERGLTRKPKNALAAMAGETVGLLSPVVAAAKAPQIARGLLQVGENATAPNVVNRGAAGGQRGIFMGDLSKTWNKEAAAKAEAMEKAGADARAIWQETGTFRGADGKWRQEIHDAAAFKPEIGMIDGETTYRTMEGSLYHPSAFKAYPELRDMDTVIGRLPNTIDGSYQGAVPATKESFGRSAQIDAIGPSRQDIKSTLLHEMQHHIQNRQGFASGGNVNTIKTADVLPKYSEAMKQADNIADHEARVREATRIYKEGRFDAYRRLAGEAEARAVQSRMNLTPQQRRALFPFDSYDVPVDSLIVR